MGVYLVYAGLLVWCHRAAREQMWQALVHHISGKDAAELPWRWPLSVATTITLPAYLLLAGVLAAGVGLIIAGCVILAAYLLVCIVYVALAAWPVVLFGWLVYWKARD